MRSRRALSPLITYLRGLGVAPAATVVRPQGVAVVLAGFGAYLASERGLAAWTAASYVSQAKPFFQAFPVGADGRWMGLTAGQVDLFVTRRALMLRPRSAQVAANAIRALVRWMWLETLITGPLDHAVGRFAASAATTLPKALTPAEVDRLFAALVGEEAEERSDDRVDATARFTRR